MDPQNFTHGTCKVIVSELFKIAGVALAEAKAKFEELRGRKDGRKVRSASKTYCHDLVEMVGKLDPLIIGRDEEIRTVVWILAKRHTNIPILIGEPGVGKTAIVEGLAHKIVSDDVPSHLANVRLIELDMGALVAGANKGEFEERLLGVLKEVEEAKGKVILFIDDIHLVLDRDRTEGSLSAANLFKAILARGQLHCIGATTLAKYQKYVEKDAAFERWFQPVYVAEPSVPETISILRGLKDKYERHHGLRIQDQALVFAAQLSARYIAGRYLPDKAIELVDRACANVRVQLDCRRRRDDLVKASHQRYWARAIEEIETAIATPKLTDIIGSDQIIEVVSKWTGIPVTRLRKNEKQTLIGLGDRLRQRVVGQNHVIDAVAKIMLLLKSRADLEALPHVDHEDILTAAVRRQPCNVILFDQVEKADTAMSNTLLPVLDDGRVTNYLGQIVDFRNTVVIMTSNLGAEHPLSARMGNNSIEAAREEAMIEE